MSSRRATTAQEQQWLDEVIYLHSLWRRGPPHNPNPPPPPPSAATAAATAAAKPNRRITKKKHKKAKPHPMLEKITPQSSSTAPEANPWPCLPSPGHKSFDSGWTDPPPKPKPPPLSAAAKAQQGGVKASQEFFSRECSSSDDDVEYQYDDGVMGEDEDEEDHESRAFRFFSELFESDMELRGYYERNWEKGEFCCLVCRAFAVKGWKRFANCVGLVQHATSISKVKGRAPHRGFAKAVCRVIGWDSEKLPTIVLPSGVSRGQLQDEGTGKEPSSQTKEEINEGVEATITDMNMPKEACSENKGDINKEFAVNAGINDGDMTEVTLLSDIADLPTENVQKEDAHGTVVPPVENKLVDPQH